MLSPATAMGSSRRVFSHPGAGKVFISYRRADSQHVSDRIYEHLVERFGDDTVFKDVDSIPPAGVRIRTGGLICPLLPRFEARLPERADLEWPGGLLNPRWI